jgi:hypothetical protein
MSKYKLGDELVFVGAENGKGFYTRNKQYTITADHGDGQYQLTDNGDGDHWWETSTLDENFRFMSSPVREITRKELVAGKYGPLTVGIGNKSGVPIYIGGSGAIFTADQLRDAARVFTEIADYLDESTIDTDQST